MTLNEVLASVDTIRRSARNAQANRDKASIRKRWVKQDHDRLVQDVLNTGNLTMGLVKNLARNATALEQNESLTSYHEAMVEASERSLKERLGLEA